MKGWLKKNEACGRVVSQRDVNKILFAGTRQASEMRLVRDIGDEGVGKEFGKIVCCTVTCLTERSKGVDVG